MAKMDTELTGRTQVSRVAESVEEKLRHLSRSHGAGARLPSVRSLMRTCGVSQLSVFNALATLEAEGLIVRKSRSGTYVADSPRVLPRLILCDPKFFIHPSPFCQMLFGSICNRYVGADCGAVIRFTNPLLHEDDAVAPQELLTPDIWEKLRAKRFSSVLLYGTDPRLTPLLAEFDLPIVGLGTDAPYTLRFGMVDACQFGVAELARLGCRKVILYNAPYLQMREVFMAALESHNLESAEIFHEDLPEEGYDKLVVRPYHLVEKGRSAAHRSIAAGNFARNDYGILSFDDTFTQGFIHGLIDHGLSVGDDVEIATYANRNSPVLGPWEAKMTRMELDIPLVVDAMHECADRLCHGLSPDKSWFAAGLGSWGPFWSYVHRLTLRRRGERDDRDQVQPEERSDFSVSMQSTDAEY